MNDKIFDIDMNVWDNTRNVIKLISFHRFQGQINSTIHIYVWRYHHSSISNWKLHTDKNYNSIEMLLINHLSNQRYVIRRSSYDALSLLPSFQGSFCPQFCSHVPGEITRPMTLIREREIFLVALYYQCVLRSVTGPELWYLLFSALRVDSFRLLIFAVHFSAPRGLLGTPFRRIFILPLMQVWLSMLGGWLSLWWPGPESGKIE
jgi:hypothetical protein